MIEAYTGAGSAPQNPSGTACNKSSGRRQGALNVVLMTTSDARGDRLASLARMLESVDAFAHAKPEVPVTQILLVQGGTLEAGLVTPNARDRLKVMHVPGRISLSAARNIMIDFAAAEGHFDEGTLVLFPDDDCWYPPGVLDGIWTAFARDPELDFWFCRYRSSPAPYPSEAGKAALPREVARRASSNTMAFRGYLFGDAARGGLRFDKALGVGTPTSGGEDTDVALAAYGRARKALFLNEAVVGHRDYDATHSGRYYRGTLVAIAKNGRISGVGREFGRKLLVGAYLVLRGRLRPGAYLGAIGMGLRAYFQPSADRV